MKAIIVYDCPPVKVGDKSYPYTSLVADSAIGRDVMPLFVPDIPVRWCACVCVAARIERLGKNIAEKFALRYVDAIGTVCLLYPDPDDPCSAALTVAGAVSVLDSAVTTGHWVECAPQGIDTIEVNVCGESRTYDIGGIGIARHISEVSRLATLKTGDIIILKHTAVPADLMRNTRIRACVNGIPALDLKVK